MIKGDKLKRRYMLGCLKAFLKSTATKKFYDLERLKFRGNRTDVDFGFDNTKVLSPEKIAELKAAKPELAADVNYKGRANTTTSLVSACGAPNGQPEHDHDPVSACCSPKDAPSSEAISVCGAPNDLPDLETLENVGGVAESAGRN
jgi:anaerobic magnesium-protoporphyrin IX monomethyl ester cyclase